MRWVHDFWYYYSRTFVCMVIIDALLVGVIVFLLVEDKNHRETILKLRLEINDRNIGRLNKNCRPGQNLSIISMIMILRNTTGIDHGRIAG